jgi:RNA polymerase sigma-70 factor, ECF subfamily
VTETQRNTHHEQELAWIQQALSGNRDGFTALMGRYHAPLKRILMSILHRTEDAEDVLQETFLRAFRFLHRYDSNRSFGPWLFRIGSNLARNHLSRVRSREPLSLDASPDREDSDRFDGEWTADLSTVTELEYRELLTRTKEALSGLPDDQRVILEMRLIGEMSYKEIAAALSIPIGTVMSRLNRGRRKLQETLADYGDAESQDADRNALRPAESPEAP